MSYVRNNKQDLPYVFLLTKKFIFVSIKIDDCEKFEAKCSDVLKMTQSSLRVQQNGKLVKIPLNPAFQLPTSLSSQPISTNLSNPELWKCY